MDWRTIRILLLFACKLIFIIHCLSVTHLPTVCATASQNRSSEQYQDSPEIDDLLKDFAADQDEFDTESDLETDKYERLYSQDEILEAIRKNTEDFFKTIVESRHLGSTVKTPKSNEDSEDSVIRISKRSLSPEDYYYSEAESNEDTIPDHLLKGIWPLSSIVDITPSTYPAPPNSPTHLVSPLCPTKGSVIDFEVIKFNSQNYILCLTRTGSNFTVRYGPLGAVDYSLSLSLSSVPQKLMAFTAYESQNEDLILLVLSQKRHPDDVGVVWFQINTANVAYQTNHLSNLYRLNVHNCFVLAAAQTVVFHDVHEAQLKSFQYNNGHFDPSSVTIPAPPDMSVAYGYEESQASFMILGFQSMGPHRSKPRDAEIYVWNNNLQRFVRSLSGGGSISPLGIACEDSVRDIKFFTIGHGQSREKFLTIVERGHVVFYKKAAQRFIVFQRLSMPGVRRVEALGNEKRQFVLTVVYETNNVQFVVYNSLVFRPATTQQRLFVQPQHSIRLEQLDANIPVFQLMIGRPELIQVFELTFYHDQSLLEAWKSNFDWCKARRQEALNLERQTRIVETRLTEAFFKTEPLHVRGTIIVPRFQYRKEKLEAQAFEYAAQNQGQRFKLDQRYFDALKTIRSQLESIDSRSNAQNGRLEDALLHNSHHPQRVSGNYHFNNVRIRHHNSRKSGALSVETKELNSHEVSSLRDDTIRIRGSGNSELHFIRPMSFAALEHSTDLRVTAPVLLSGRFNVSNLVTTDAPFQFISGKKNFKNILLVDEALNARTVNGNNFTSHSVLTTLGNQRIQNEVTFKAGSVRAGKLHVTSTLNGANVRQFFDNFALKSHPTEVHSPVVFESEMKSFVLRVSGPLNGHNVERLAHDTVWSSSPNQTWSGDYRFASGLLVDEHLFVDRVNDRNIPSDLVLVSAPHSHIRGRKLFHDPLTVDELYLTSGLNGLPIQKDGLPDLILKHHPQNITGFKRFESLQIANDSIVHGPVNGIDLADLDRRIRQKPKVKKFEKIFVDKFANFEEGFQFNRLNGLSRSEFERLLERSVSINDPFDKFRFEKVFFHDLDVDLLDVSTVNGLSLENQLLNRNLTQTIFGRYHFRADVHLNGLSSVDTVNNVSLSNLDNLFRVNGDQELDTETRFVDNVRLHSLRVKTINSIPFEEIVFLDSVDTKPISGRKTFVGESFNADEIRVNDLFVNRLNSQPLSRLLYETLRKSAPQTISRGREPVFVQTMLAGSDFKVHYLNGVQLPHLLQDVVFGNLSATPQNISAFKHFTGPVQFDGGLHFGELFDGVTDWALRHDWMLQNVPQRVEATFTLEKLVADNVFVDNDRFNNVPLQWLSKNAARRDRNTVFHGPIEFIGKATSLGNVQIGSTMNGIRLNEDVLLHEYSGIQTVRGNVTLHGRTIMRNNLDLRTRLVNGIDVNALCSSIYQSTSNQRQSLAIAGNVAILNELRFGSMNNMTLKEITHDSLRFDVPRQVINGRRVIDTLFLNGPTILDSTLNNINLTHLSLSYLSRSHDQVVETDVILNGPQIIAGNVDIAYRLFVEDNRIMNIDLAKIEATSLKRSENQLYTGNIDFVGETHFRDGFNSPFINAHDTSAYMSKTRPENTFHSEVFFSQSVRVTDNLNIINRKTISGVDVGRMFESSVLRNQPTRNFSLSGKKILENVIVNVIHTEKINRIKVSKHHLLLRSENQIVTGRMDFNGSVKINNLYVNQINQLPFNAFSDSLVRRSKPVNVIETAVRLEVVDAGHVRAHGLIDNVNISVLNQISETVGFLRSMENSTVHYRAEFESFQRKLSGFSSKFMFFEDVPVPALPKTLLGSQPALVQRLHDRLVIVPRPAEARLSTAACQQVSVHVAYSSSGDHAWRLVNIDVPGRVSRVELFGSYLVTIFVPSIPSSSSVTNHCFKESRDILQNLPANTSLAVRVDRLLVENGPQTELDLVAGISSLTNEKVVRIHFLRENILLLCSKQHCTALCLTCSPESAVFGTLKLSSPVVSIALPATPFQNLFAIVDANSRLNVYELSRAAGLTLKPKLSMFAFNVRSVSLIYESRSTGVSDFILLTYKQSSQYQTRNGAHLYGLDFGAGRFLKMQELAVEGVERAASFYRRSGQLVEPYILLQSRTQISIFRMFSSGLVESLGTLSFDGRLQWWSINRHNELSLLTGSVFEDSLPGQSCSLEDVSGNLSFRLLKACFRQEILYGISELSTGDEHYRRREASNSSTVFMNAVIT